MKVKVVVVSPIVGNDFSYKASKDPVSLDDDMAFDLALAGFVKWVNKKAYARKLEEHQNKLKKSADAAVEANAILKKDRLETELNGLYNDVVLKEAELNGVVLDGEQILEMVEELKKRVLPINDGYFDLNSLGGDN